MAKKILKKKKEQQEHFPKFYIVRWMRNGRETYRSLIDDVHFITWMALNNHEESIEQLARYKAWSRDFQDTYNFIKNAHLEATTEDDRERNKFILSHILQDPFYVKVGEITYEFEPFDIGEMEYVTDVQREHQRVAEEQRKERLKIERAEKKANRLRRIMGNRFKTSGREQLV